MKDNPLNVQIMDDELILTVGIDTLVNAIEKEWGGWDIVNHENYIKDLIRAMIRENENGETLLTKMFSEAAQIAYIKEEKADKDQWWILKNQ